MGTLPKRNPARRNQSTTRATLSVDRRVQTPELPEGDWQPATLMWWRDIWASPMAPEFDKSDIHGLLILAALVDDFWRHPSKEMAGEIRLQRQCFGLSPIDRRRLQWEIERTDEAQARGSRRRTAAAPKADPAVDPRSVLRAV